jgi:hypothetical protein
LNSEPGIVPASVFTNDVAKRRKSETSLYLAGFRPPQDLKCKLRHYESLEHLIHGTSKSKFNECTFTRFYLQCERTRQQFKICDFVVDHGSAR